jgi:hypothetical protein
MKSNLAILVILYLSTIVVMAQQGQTPATVAPPDSPQPNKPKVPQGQLNTKGAATTNEVPLSKQGSPTTPVFFISCFNPNDEDVHHAEIDLKKVPAKVREYAERAFVRVAEITRINRAPVNLPEQPSTKQKTISEFSDLKFDTYPYIPDICNHETLIREKSYKFDFALSAQIKLDPNYSNQFWRVTFVINSKNSPVFVGLEDLKIPCVQNPKFNTDSVAKRVIKYMRTNKQVFLSYINNENKKKLK